METSKQNNDFRRFMLCGKQKVVIESGLFPLHTIYPMWKYTYVRLESFYYTLAAPCNQSVFQIKYINSKHYHCESDYTFTLKMKAMNRDEFSKPGSIQVNKLDIYEEELCGGVSGPASNVDITLIWDKVSLVGNVYSGKGRFIINKDIPSSSKGYYYPAQEIPFEFHPRLRLIH